MWPSHATTPSRPFFLVFSYGALDSNLELMRWVHVFLCGRTDMVSVILKKLLKIELNEVFYTSWAKQDFEVSSWELQKKKCNTIFKIITGERMCSLFYVIFACEWMVESGTICFASKFKLQIKNWFLFGADYSEFVFIRPNSHLIKTPVHHE